ncbi:MAG: MBL fold metallo-hydrolase [Anaerolineae bacterium]
MSGGGSTLILRWLGAAGVELTCDGRVLVLDPFVSRFPLWRLIAGRVRTDERLCAQLVPACHHILISHAHFDHLLDAPAIAGRTGAVCLGSPNACKLLLAHGVLPAQVQPMAVGARLPLGPFAVEVLPGDHGRILGFPTPAGPLRTDLRPPLRALDYRMDACFGFLIEAGGVRVLAWGSERSAPAPEADVLLLGGHRPRAILAPLLAQVRPRLVIPLHWDDLFRPLSRGVRPMFAPPALRWPPLRRMDPKEMARVVAQVAPRVQVLVPQVRQMYALGEWLDGA